MRTTAPVRGAGVGLRPCHYREILATRPPVPWFEVLADNYFSPGLALALLEQVRADYPVTLHSVGLSLGATDALDADYLARLRELAARVEPAWVSDHLAWIACDGTCLHELLPLPYTEESLAHVARRIEAAQEALGRQLLIENPSSYLTFRDSTLPEAQFLAELVARSGCALLLDINNAYVSAVNHGWDLAGYLEALPVGSVREIHLAGYEARAHHLFDTHGQRVHAPVWDWYARAIGRFGAVPTLIEWDTDIPPLAVLCEEAARATRYLREAA